MKIQKVLSRLRNDFRAVYECEHCGASEEDYGYEDSHFHVHVIPSKQCKNCGKDRAGNRPELPGSCDKVTEEAGRNG